MAASYDFVQLDVFTQTPLAGNPLAVFTDARGLTFRFVARAYTGAERARNH
jgi:predicted PhzF superfamily epimerase YddE/YHI9